jgi:hypothetical protein
MVALIATVAGLVWKHQSNPPSDTLSRQQRLQVFVSDPESSVQLTAAYAPLNDGQDVEFLYLSVIPPVPNEDVKWAIVSLGNSLTCSPYVTGNLADIHSGRTLPSFLDFGIQPTSKPLPAWFCFGDTQDLSTIQNETLPGIGTVASADPIAAGLTSGTMVSDTRMASVDQFRSGTLYAHLPALDLEALPQPGVAMFFGAIHESTTVSRGQRYVNALGQVAVCQRVACGASELTFLLDEFPKPLSEINATSPNISDYQQPAALKTILGGPYFVPDTVKTQAVLELARTKIASGLVNYRQDQVNPSDGAFENGNFVWTGTGSIEPTLSLSDPNSDQARQSDAFYAGIALAIAAAALIALIQELPKGRRRRQHT